jgi:long-chain fatty acid transport protein
MRTEELAGCVVRCCRAGAALAALAALLGLGLWPARAEGFRNPPEGGATLGRAAINIAQDDDASTVARNPANLVLLPSAQVQVGANVIHSKVKFTSALSGVTDTTEDPWKLLPYAFASMPLNKNLALGLGVDVPFGQSTVWSKEGQFRYTAPTFAELRVFNINPALSAKLGDRLCVGLGADVYVSDIEIRQFLPWSQLAGPGAPDGLEKLTGSGVGLGGNAALTWLVTDGQRLALTYRSPVKVNYDGHFQVDNIPALMQRLVLPRADFSTSITFPSTIGLGYSCQPADKLKVEADVEWIEFSRYDSLALDAAGDNPLLHPAGDPTPPTAPATIPQDWKDAWTAGISAEYQCCPDWALRAGYQFIQSPVPDTTLAPTLPDDDRSVVSVGLGYQHGAHALDFAFLYSFFHKRTTTAQPVPPYNGTYDIASQILAASYTFAF